MPVYRYPVGELNESSDFLRIQIAAYTANPLTRGSGTTDLSVDVKTKGAQGVQTNTQTLTAGKPFQVSRRGKNTKTIDETIFLPIPSNIQDGNSVKYTEGSLDGLTAGALGIVLNAFYENDDNPGQVLQSMLKAGTNLGLDPGARQYFLNNLAASAANIPFGGNLTPSQLLARQTGNILNPNMELLFDGVTLRSFKFSFKMTPRNKTEAEQVRKIILTLKKSMAPGSSSKTGFDNQQSNIEGLYLSTPKIFILNYMRGSADHPFLHKFKECFLTDMSVNYTGEGTYATYGGLDADGGGTPVSMIMDLSFKELEPIYAGDYGTTGVGY